MNILCVIPYYWPAFQYGGPVISLHGLNKALVEKGVDIKVYTTNAGLIGKVNVNQERDVDGVRVTYFLFTKLFEFMGTSGWQLSLPLTKALKNNLKAFDIVYIVSIWNFPTAIAAYYCRKYKKPYIIAPKGMLYPYTIAKKSWKKWSYYTLVSKRDIHGAAAIHYTTEDELEKCHSFLGLRNRALIIPNGIDINCFDNLPGRKILRNRYPFLKNKKVILFLGRINWKKGLDILVKAYGYLASEIKDVHLLIAGPDEDGYEKKVKKWLSDEGVLGQATFTGMLKGKEKIGAYASSNLFVLPSYSENFGMSAIEAMACKLPIVISNQVGIYREVERNRAGIVCETNAESLYKGIRMILNNTEFKNEITLNARRLVEDYYDIHKVSGKMIGYFEEVIKKYSSSKG